jgi:hypothetical protein
VMGQVADSLREAAKSAETASAQAIREAAKGTGSASEEIETDQSARSSEETDEPSDNDIADSFDQQYAAYKAKYAPSTASPPPAAEVPSTPVAPTFTSRAAERAAYKSRALGHAAHKMDRAAQKMERKARLMEERARQVEPDERDTACGGVARSIFSGLGLISVVNLGMLWYAGVTGDWSIYQMGWPIQLFLVSMALSMIMMATGASGMLIPIGLILGNGAILSYYSLTNDWERWDTWWPLEPLLAIGVVWFTISISGHGRFSRRFSRLFGFVLWVAAGLASYIIFDYIATLPR